MSSPAQAMVRCAGAPVGASSSPNGFSSFAPTAQNYVQALHRRPGTGYVEQMKNLDASPFSGVMECEPTGSCLKAQLYEAYSSIEQRILVENEDARTTYNSPVNFIESMQVARHRWFPYKEGFSPSFVEDFLKEFSPDGGLVFDPFSGSGTTALVAAKNGRRSIGFDVSELTTFVATAKAIELKGDDLSAFKLLLDNLRVAPLNIVAPRPENETVCRYFLAEHLDALLAVKAFYQNVKNDAHRALLKLAFLTAIEPFSTHRKAGNGVKRKTKFPLPESADAALADVRNFVLRQLDTYLVDLEADELTVAPKYRVASSLDGLGEAFDEDVSCVLTSPPYANCFDYSKIYMSELWLGDFFRNKTDQAEFRAGSVRSHVHATWEPRYSRQGSAIIDQLVRPQIEAQDLWSPRIGQMLSGYFQDLGKFLAAIKPKLADGAALGFVVGNSFYGGIAVATDLILADLAQNLGYDVDRVRVYRGVIPSSQQYRKLGENRKYMRESLVVLRNNSNAG